MISPTRAVSRRLRPIEGRRWWGAAFVAPYLLLLTVFGVIPTMLALLESFRVTDRRTGVVTFGIGNYSRVLGDFRLVPAGMNVVAFLAIWLPVMVVGVLGLALLLHARINRFSAAVRTVYILPGAVIGAAAVLLWLMIIDPSVSPFAPVLELLGVESSRQVLSDGSLPVLFAVMAFTTGSGSWIVIMYGAMQNISSELVEAARLDGCNAWQLARHIKLPLISKYIVYMLVLNFAIGVQIFVEPQLISQLSPGGGVSSPWWSLNQLAYAFFFDQGNFGATAAISVLLLVIGLAGALLIIFGTQLFETDTPE